LTTSADEDPFAIAGVLVKYATCVLYDSARTKQTNQIYSKARINKDYI